MMRIFAPNSPLGRWLSFFLDALLISVAWALCTVPVITAGAAAAALHRVAHNWMRERSDCDLKAYFRAFRENFAGATMVWLILLVPLAVILGNIYLAFFSQAPLPGFVKWIVALVALLWLAVAAYAFALQALFENSPLRMVSNALRLAGAYPVTTLVLVLLLGLAVFCTVLFPPGVVFYVPMCIFLSARPLWAVFSKVKAREEGAKGE